MSSVSAAKAANEDWFDFVVVGAGAAGAVLASRLSEDETTTVCQLESGPNDNHPFIKIPAGFTKIVGSPTHSWGFTTEPSEDVAGRRIEFTQARVVGGGTSINGMVAVRGQREDYDAWAQAGADGWSYEGVLPYFRKLERMEGPPSPFRGDSGQLRIVNGRWRNPACDAFVEALGALGVRKHVDYNGEDQESVGYTQFLMNGRFRVSAASAYLNGKARRRPNYRLLTNATAERILFEGRRAVGVRYRRPDGSTSVVRARREVVISAGAINTPRLLQISGIGPAEWVKSLGVDPVVDLPAGKGLQDHYLLMIKARGEGFPSLNRLAKGVPLLWQIGRWMLDKPSIITMGPAFVSFFVKSDPSLATADIQGMFTPGSYRGRQGVRVLDDYLGMACAVWQHRPYSVGEVRALSTDITVHPLIQPNYLADERDQRVAVAGLKMARKALESPEMARFKPVETTPGPKVQTDDEWLGFARRAGSTAYHPMGTARIGRSDDPNAVIDPMLRVHGVDALRVADASIMPTMPSCNLSIPSMMIGEKGSDIIRGRSIPNLPI